MWWCNINKNLWIDMKHFLWSCLFHGQKLCTELCTLKTANISGNILFHHSVADKRQKSMRKSICTAKRHFHDENCAKIELALEKRNVLSQFMIMQQFPCSIVFALIANDCFIWCFTRCFSKRARNTVYPFEFTLNPNRMKDINAAIFLIFISENISIQFA